MKIIWSVILLLCVCSSIFANPSTAPIVTAEKYMEYKKQNGHLNKFIPPKIVLVCYQQSTLQHLLDSNPDMKLCDSFTHLYLIEGGNVGVLGGWGMGAPALSIKIEELIALGVTKFIAVGTAGSLMDKHRIGEFIIAQKALAEDGVAHLYLNGKSYASVDEKLFSMWNEFSKNHALPSFHPAGAWSFSAIFRETAADVIRVTMEGYDVVEMEAATLYAIGQEKGVQTLSLFVISDTLTDKVWIPHIKEPKVRNNLHKLSEWALEFCRSEVKKS
jgi:uridine phosphorylase